MSAPTLFPLEYVRLEMMALFEGAGYGDTRFDYDQWRAKPLPKRLLWQLAAAQTCNSGQ